MKETQKFNEDCCMLIPLNRKCEFRAHRFRKNASYDILFLGAINLSQLHPAWRRSWITEGLAIGIALKWQCFEGCAICTVS